jgi:hypothetical protein
MERVTALFAMIVKQPMGIAFAKCFFAKQLRRAAQPSTDNKKDKKQKNDREFIFEGKEYNTYSAMVDAKRECNKIWLEKSGLQETAQCIKEATKRQKSATYRKVIIVVMRLTHDYYSKKLSATLRLCLPSKFSQEGAPLNR